MSELVNTNENDDQSKKLKPCCACPETKAPRDKWYGKKVSNCNFAKN